MELRREGLGRRRRARRAGLPRRLRHRHVEHGPRHPLRPAQRRGGCALRTRLRALGRHGGGDAPRGRAPLEPRNAPRPARVRHPRLHPAVRADLHERAQHARPGGHPHALARPRRGRPHHRRGRQLRLQPRTPRALHRRLRAGRGRGGHRRAGRAGARLEARGRAPLRAPARPAGAAGNLRARLLRGALRRPRPFRRPRTARCRSAAGHPAPRGRAAAAAAHAPHRALPADRARPRRRGDPAGLYAGLPLLPGGHDLPPHARTQPR